MVELGSFIDVTLLFVLLRQDQCCIVLAHTSEFLYNSPTVHIPWQCPNPTLILRIYLASALLGLHSRRGVSSTLESGRASVQRFEHFHSKLEGLGEELVE
jgi:hypothetical protein